MTRIVIYNQDTWTPIEVIEVEMKKRWILKGECIRCGKCCRNNSPYPKGEDGYCGAHKWENTAGEHPVSVCTKQWNKPFGCAVWPVDLNDPPEGCGIEIVEAPYIKYHFAKPYTTKKRENASD